MDKKGSSDLIDNIAAFEKDYDGKSNNGKTKLIIKIIVYAILWLAIFVSIPFSPSIERGINRPTFSFAIGSNEFAVHFVDVGQGDCAIIQLPDGKTVMIDTGPATSRNNVKRYLSALSLTTIDYLIITHPDKDHVGNAKMIFENYEILHTYVPKVSSNYMESRGLNENHYKLISTNVWSNVTEAMYNERCDISYNFKNEKIYNSEFEYSIDFFTPLSDNQSSSNDYSPIILVTLQDVKFMFTGDADMDKEQEFLDEYSALISADATYFDVDVLKVGHHGSKTSTKIDFLNVTRPEMAIISCGSGNKYGHPNLETLEKLEISSCDVMRTDLTGSIVVTKNSGGITNVVCKTNFNHYNDFYLEWRYVLIVLGGLLLMASFVIFRKNEDAQNG